MTLLPEDLPEMLQDQGLSAFLMPVQAKRRALFTQAIACCDAFASAVV